MTPNLDRAVAQALRDSHALTADAVKRIADYYAFVANKADIVVQAGFDVRPEDLPAGDDLLKAHQRDMITWAARRGRALIAASFGLGKTRVQCELLRLAHIRTGKPALIICPLGVRHQFTEEDGPALGLHFQYVRTDAEAEAAKTPYLITNYERVRDGDISPTFIRERIGAVSLDEGAILGNLGTKTQVQFGQIFEDTPFRWVATATPAPNDYRQLIYFADFLGEMDAGQALTRWFGRNPDEAGDLQLLPHMEREFWLWVASWALFVDKPSDLGYSDDGYVMPELEIRWHRLTADHQKAWDMVDNLGQHFLFKDTAAGVVQAIREKRDSMGIRVAEAARIIAEEADPDEHFILWHHLEDERRAIAKAIPGVTEIYGSQDLDERERKVLDFSRGKLRLLATKPELSGSGCNFQHHCHRAIYLGLSFKFRDFIQSVHRILRYMQGEKVIIDMIHTDAEDHVVDVLMQKWEQHDALTAHMKAIIAEYGLTSEALVSGMQRAIGVQRQEARGSYFTAVNNDTVIEAERLGDNSVDCIITSIPFGNHYEYVASLNDFGHNPDDGRFWEQMDYLVPHLYRVLKPGRIAAIHVKDRLLYGHQNEWHTTAVWPFSDDTNRAFIKHGFIPYGRITVATDVVRENNSTNRLGWSENSKDGTKMGVGLPEYVLLFRKPQTDIARSYADEPVRKDKADYSRMRWQVDAHAFWRSNGNRHLTPEELIALEPERLKAMDTGSIYRWYQAFGKTHGYDFEGHIRLGETLNEAGKDRLPAKFGLFLPPAPETHEDYVWTDVLFMRTLNMENARRRVEKHVCPLPLDIVERLIVRYSNPDELVFDPFGGLMTVPYLAVKLGRAGYGCELNPDYWRFGVSYLRDAEEERNSPTLFDLLDLDAPALAEAA